MKKHLFKFLINKIPFGKNDLETVQYYTFVKKHKMIFVSKYSFENNISNTNIVKELYDKIVNETAYHPIILEVIEEQIEVSNEMYIELKIEMKEFVITFANEVKDLTYVLNFFNVMHTLKHPMMAKLAIINH